MRGASSQVAFLRWGTAGTLPKTFTDRAGWGDVASGVVALDVLAARKDRAALFAANVSGAVDLAVAIVTGIATVLREDPAMRAIRTFPRAMIPLFGVGLTGPRTSSHSTHSSASERLKGRRMSTRHRAEEHGMFRVMTFNANGIRAATRKGFFRWMHAQRPDVVCMQETKAQEAQIPPEAIGLPDYHTAFVDAEKKGYSGVAIYSRREPDAVVRGTGFEEFDHEGRFVRMDFGDLRVASLYVPSGTSGAVRQAVKYAFLERFIASLAAMAHDGVPTIVCGDYNIAHRAIDVFDPKSCARVTGFLPDERAWFDDVVERVGWVDAFREINTEPKQFSWWSNFPNAFERNLGWRIDYQLITPDLAPRVRAVSIYRDERFSDHAPVTIDYDLSPPATNVRPA